MRSLSGLGGLKASSLNALGSDIYMTLILTHSALKPLGHIIKEWQIIMMDVSLYYSKQQSRLPISSLLKKVLNFMRNPKHIFLFKAKSWTLRFDDRIAKKTFYKRCSLYFVCSYMKPNWTWWTRLNGPRGMGNICLYLKLNCFKSHSCTKNS